MFEVYTYFGRILNRFAIPENETHHATLEKARLFLECYEKTENNPAWMRYINQ